MLGAVMQQAIAWGIVDTDLYHHMASLGHNDLNINGIVQDCSISSMLAMEIPQS